MQINFKVNNYANTENNYLQKNNNPSFGVIDIKYYDLPKRLHLHGEPYKSYYNVLTEAGKCPARTRIYLENSRLHASISYYDGKKKWFLGRHKAKRKENLLDFVTRMHNRTLKHMSDFNRGKIPRQELSMWQRIQRAFQEPRGEW